MKTNSYIKFIIVVLVICCAVTGCRKENSDTKQGSIYGCVTDFATGEPVGNVNVKIRPTGETTLTGSDGIYEFDDLKAGKYSLLLSKAEYADLDDDYVIELEAGKKVRRDVQLRKKVASLKITDMVGNPLDTLDFGDEESVKVKTFNVFNDGTETLTCTVTYDCEWITNVSGLENQVHSGQTVPVTVKIDRVALDDGVNTTFLTITSANGSNEVVVKATFLGAAVINTIDATEVTSNSVTLGGNIIDDGGRPVKARGICYGTSQNPDIYGDHTQDGSGTGEFSHNITGLSASTTYYARAYATNCNGTYYASNIVSFTTTDGLPTVTTADVFDVTATTAKGGGEVTNNGGHNVTARGVCWNTMGSPDLNDQHTTNGNGNGTFTSNIVNLAIGMTYHVRAYATNSHGTSFGDEITFTTANGNASITLSNPTDITATSASFSAEITNDGGATITERGLCWSTSQYPTIENSHKVVGSGTGSYTASLSGLIPAATYYVRAYAINAAGPSYSNQIDFTTNDGLPIVTTGGVSNITATSATCSGNVTSDGGFDVTSKGFCWSTAQYPTVSDSHSNVGNGTGPINGSITNLQVNKTYYVRAYATNSKGTSYGNQEHFTTGNGLPSVTTTSPTLNGTTVITGGNVTSDGGFFVTARGVCYGPLPDPDLTSTYSHTNNGSGTGYFTSTFSLPNGYDTYYIRSYATNVNSTTYGNQVVVIKAYYELPTFTFNGHIYRVAPLSSSNMAWTQAKSYCNNLNLYGYSDWIFPTINQLQQLYNELHNTELFAGLLNDACWSSTFAGYNSYNGINTYYVLGLGFGDVFDDNETQHWRVFPIRLEQ